MLCQHCNKNHANTYISRTVNGKTEKMYLCSECAAEAAGEELSFFADPFSSLMDASFGSLLGFPVAVKAPAAATGRVCPKCGATLEYISDTGRLGCAGCYDFFEDALAPVIRRVHGDVKHISGAGKAQKSAPAESAPADKASQLRAQLEKAVKDEEFEKAAKLRDELRALESGKNGEDKKDEK